MLDYKYQNVLWLIPTSFTGGIESLLKKYLKEADIETAPIKYRNFTHGCLQKKTKTTYTWRQDKYAEFERKVLQLKPDFIVVNDKAALGFITQKYLSLSLTRGSIYKWKGINVLIIDELKKTKYDPTASWALKQDVSKLKRWLTGKQRHQPKFAYKVCRDKSDLEEFKQMADESVLISIDIETSGRGKNVLITCSGYTCWHKSGKVFSWVIPFIDTTQSDGCYWRTAEEEIYAYQQLKHVHKNQAYKVMQNGSYDSTHFITYHLPLNNYLFDTLHLFHSIWSELPKRLDFISSVCVDFYRYWKDESKEDTQKDDKQSSKIPQTVYGLKTYWRYNALDVYYTLMNTVYLMMIHNQPSMQWAKENYIREFRLQMGPALAGSMRGCKWNKKIQKHFNDSLTLESKKALKDLRIMVGDSEFNPNSTKDMPRLIYDILKAEEIPRQGRTVGEPVLKLIATQHPFINKIIQQIWKVKKPANNASKYGELHLLNGRFMYKLSAAGTEMPRFASKTSDFWYGTNAQNLPKEMRVVFEPDDGYVLFDFDYSQSDGYFTAFDLQDSTYMEVMTNDKDVHCINAEHFFQIPYDKLYAAKKADEDWCVHPTKGVRSVTKRVVYGANYLMAAYTLFITMGREAVVAAAEHLGYEDAGGWNLDKLVFICGKFLEAYFEKYDLLKPGLEEKITLVKATGNLAVCFGGHTRLFLGDLSKDAVKRKLASFYGQGGTGLNINSFLDDFYYTDGMFTAEKYSGQIDFDSDNLHDSSDIMFFFQVHDSVVGQVKKDKLYLLKDLKQKMERTCKLHGHEFTVPVEGEIGYGWGKRMIDWHPDITLKEIEAHETKWWTNFYNLKEIVS